MFTQISLDRSPAITAVVREITDTAPGTYSFSSDDTAVWKWKGDWALNLTAKLPEVPKTVSGRIVFHSGT